MTQNNIPTEVEKVEKAYGGCHYCYGKGYGTQTASIAGHRYRRKLPTMEYCTCQRGKQLQTLVEEEKKKAVEEARREGAWIGFHASGEGFNGEYTHPGVTDERIWKTLDSALTQPTNQ